MPDGTSRGEGSRHGEQDDFLVGPFFGCVIGLWDAAGCDGRVLWGVGDIAGIEESVSSGGYDDMHGKCRVDRIVLCWKGAAYEKTTSSGNLSPCLRPDILRCCYQFNLTLTRLFVRSVGKTFFV
jgi:hypothetical protein